MGARVVNPQAIHMARYNGWMNGKLCECSARLTDAQLTTLQSQRGIDPGGTDLVWLPLEER